MTQLNTTQLNTVEGSPLTGSRINADILALRDILVASLKGKHGTGESSPLTAGKSETADGVDYETSGGGAA